MYLSNLLTSLRMIFDPRVIKFLFKSRKLTKKDSSFKLKKFILFMKFFLKKEKIVYHEKKYVINSLAPQIPSEAFLDFLNGYYVDGELLKNIGEHKRKYPLSTFIKVTDKCNFNCFYCSAKFKSTKKELTLENWIDIVKKLNELGTCYIGITGGEPLLLNGIEKIISTINEKSFSVLFTNGTNLSLQKAKQLKSAGLFAISISLDSQEREIQNEIRGHANAYEIALKAIENSRKAGLYTIVQSVVFKKYLNKYDFYALCRFVKSKGAHEIRIHKPVFSGAMTKDENNIDMCYNENDLKKLFSLQDSVNRKFFRYPKVSAFPYTEGPEKFGCTAGTLHSYISETGEVTPCDFIPISFGNALEEDLNTIYHRMSTTMCFNRSKCLGEKVNKLMADNKISSFKENEKLIQKLNSDVPIKFIQQIKNK